MNAGLKLSYRYKRPTGWFECTRPKDLTLASTQTTLNTLHSYMESAHKAHALVYST